MNDMWANFFPYFAGAFKLIILGIGGYLAIKWHFDEDKRVRAEEGAEFNKPTFKKKIAMMGLFTILVTVLVVVVVYATDWLLY
ncbi:hypothetical protein [Vibrio sagamiensis]|uniref:Uncharacterized protein n=1 Tax=Vibrio sagamiensis NBRC 104589 TaxID=1219064 RepID=A0A511QHB0_9VIBR|nr:hypothetical protein [Vibrio sagamiensis]PNQ53642.1 hypothetical protein C1141_20200 [Vibrio agarivorans]GEM75832.1 hypothetical protein VSA01S_19440 [Vibrio sagamiensis NBRC 104589]